MILIFFFISPPVLFCPAICSHFVSARWKLHTNTIHIKVVSLKWFDIWIFTYHTYPITTRSSILTTYFWHMYINDLWKICNAFFNSWRIIFISFSLHWIEQLSPELWILNLHKILKTFGQKIFETSDSYSFVIGCWIMWASSKLTKSFNTYGQLLNLTKQVFQCSYF